MNRMNVFSIVALTAGLSSTVWAQPGRRPTPEATFQAMDSDQSGAVGRAEFEAYARGRMDAVFARIDSDGSGTLSQSELDSAKERARGFRARIAKRRGINVDANRSQFGDLDFAAVDANRDGELTPDEIADARKSQRNERFKAMDSDGDEQVSQDEFTSYVETLKSGRKAPPTQPQPATE
ncbi:MAG: EF-hand domain-containing protein [Myxococcota bacterium]